MPYGLKWSCGVALCEIVMALITHKHFARALMLTLLLSGVFAFKVSAQTTTSTATLWSSTSSWTPSSVPGPTSTANVTYPITIDQAVSVSSGTYSFSANATDQPGGTAYGLNLTGGTFTVNSGSIVTFEGASSINNVTLTVKSGGTLIVGALTIGNNTKITIEAGGTLIVNGNVVDNNNGTGFLDLKGYVQVNGNYLAPAGGVSIMGTSGVFQTTGSMITSGGSTVFGSANDCTTGPCSGSSLTCGFRNQISPTSQTICSGQTATVMSSSNDVPAGTTVTYQWQWSASQGSGFTNVTNATSASLDPSNSGDAVVSSRIANRLTTYFRVKLIVNGCPTTPENYSPSSGIIFNSLTPPSVVLSSTSFSACAGISSTVNVPYTVSSGAVSKYSLSWSPSSGNLPVVTNATTSGSPISFTVPANAVIGSYTGTLTFYDANSCSPGTKTITLSISASTPVLSGLTVGQICETGVVQNTSLSYSATNSPVTYSITWNTTAINAGFSSINNASITSSPLSVSIPSSAVTGATYTGTLTVSNGCGTSVGQAFNITLLARPSITVGISPTVCFGTTSTSLSYSATSGSPTTYSISWDATVSGAGFAAVSDVVLPSSPISINIPSSAPAAIYNGTLTVRNGNSCASTGNAFTVTINALPTIALGSSPSVCSGSVSASLPYTSTSGSPTTYSISWDATALAEGFAAVSNTTLPSGSISLTVPPAAAAATYNGILTVRNGNSCVSTSNAFTVTISGLPTIALGTSPSVCSGSVSASLPYSSTSGSPTTYSIIWDATALTQGFASVSNNALPSSPISITVPAGASSSTYNGTLTVRNGNSCVSTSNAFTVTVNPSPAITLGTSASVCSGTITTSLSYSATSGSPITYSIDWDATASAAGFVSASNTALPLTPISISIPGGCAAATYNGTLTVTNGNSCSSTSNAFTIAVNALPTITLDGASAVCSSGLAQTSTLTYSATTGSPVNYSVTWDAAALSQNFINITDTNLQSSIALAIPANAAAGAYSANLTVSNGNSCVSTSNLFSVTIADSGTLTWTGSVNSDWFNTGNWTCSITPTSSNHVFIPSSLTNYPVISGSASCNDLTISSGASLSLGNGSRLSLNGHFTNNGVFTSNEGIVAFTGSLSQNVNNNGASFYTIEVNKAAGSLTIFQSLPLLHLLDIQTATAVNSNGNLVLMSSDSTTTHDASIGPIPSGASVNGNVTVNRYLSNEGNINRYIAAPVRGVTSAMFADDMTVKSGSTIRYYNEPATGVISNGYVYWSGSGTLTLGRGYLAYMYDKKRVHLDVTGTIHKGEFDYTATVGKIASYTTTSGGSSADGWNLIGNPYPSAITWGTTGWTRDQGGVSYVDGTISIPDLSITTGYPNYYHSYNYADGTGDLPGGIIAMGQAFWVHFSSAAAVLKVDESAKTSSANGRCYRITTESPSQFLKISISNGTITDNSFFKINESATDDFDIYDGYKFKNPTINCFLVDKDNEHLVMHTLSEIKESDKIYIGVELAEAGAYTLNISNVENFSNAADLFFVDKLEGVVIPLNSLSDYEFSVTDISRAITDRFFITRDKNEIHKYEDGFAVYPNPVDEILNLRSNSTKEMATAQLINQNGELVNEYKWKGLGQIDMSQLGRGIFILKIRTADRLIIKKIVRP
jgi:hypothetical protein